MTALILSRRKCSQCLCSRNRIVPKDRARQIIRDCLDQRTHFVCHKSPAGEIVHCRGVHDLHLSEAYRFATSFGIPVIERDMDANEDEQASAKGNTPPADPNTRRKLP